MIILESSEGDMLEKEVGLEFGALNNEIEYEELLAGL